MKITNEDKTDRVFPTLGITLKPGESYDDSNAKVTPSKETPIIEEVIETSAASDSTVEEVK